MKLFFWARHQFNLVNSYIKVSFEVYTFVFFLHFNCFELWGQKSLIKTLYKKRKERLKWIKIWNFCIKVDGLFFWWTFFFVKVKFWMGQRTCLIFTLIANKKSELNHSIAKLFRNWQVLTFLSKIECLLLRSLSL